MGTNNHKKTEDGDDGDAEGCGCQITCCCFSKRYEADQCQRFANAKWALLVLSMAHMIEQTIMSGLLGVCISTLEKRFELQSIESGIIASSFDMAAVCALLIITFVGEDIHKPRWIGWGIFLAGLGTLLFTLPHFISPQYTFMETELYNLCENVTVSECSTTNMRDFRYIFLVAIAIVGIGSNPLYTYAVTFFDENVKKENSALYNGIYYACGGFGPALGYLFGGATLEIYTDITSAKPDVDSTSYLWIGAWWLGFMVCGIFLMIISIPIMMLPRHLPQTEKYRKNRNYEMQKTMLKWSLSKHEKESKSQLQIRLQAVKLLFYNKPFIFLTLGCTVNCAFIYGFNTFGAKFLESVFGLSAFHSSVLYGVTAIFAAVGAQVSSGVIISKFSLSVTGILKLMICCGIFSALCSLGFFVHCPDINFAGGTVPYINETIMYSPESSCNEICGCSTDHYEPVCLDGITYFSPCFAGCTTQINDTAFTDCSCLPRSDSIVSNDTCDSAACNLLLPFIFVVFFCFFSSILTISPALQVTLRCVPFANRTLAVAMQTAIILVVGVLPGRMLTGIVLDLACVTWSTECGEKGSCRSYNRWELSRNTALLLLAQTSICVVFYVLVYMTYKPTNLEDKELDDVIEERVGDGEAHFRGTEDKNEHLSGKSMYDKLRKSSETSV
uniref:solute carrier organic anion transporter family member 4A1-like n=1 Tax=Styela clava TaxID=7725 RepID=UPI00193A5726|nr:solute carrier organic anion transporter family member 4A1-like [Styela clava]